MSTNKVALITGASQGIGAGLVQGFRDRGYRVVANSRSIKPSEGCDEVAPHDVRRGTAAMVGSICGRQQPKISCGDHKFF